MTALEARKLTEDEIKSGKTPKYTDLRDWLEIVDSFGELKKVDGVDWNLEMGTLAEILSRESKSGVVPAVLFDNVPGYPKGYRTLFAQNASFKRMALNLIWCHFVTTFSIASKSSNGNPFACVAIVPIPSLYRWRITDSQ